MQIDKLLEQRERISEKMERLGKKEKMLKAKERKIQTKKLIQSGEMVAKAKIEHLPPSALLGALLEIRERAHDEALIKSWQTKGSALLTRDKKENAQALIISSASDLDESTKTTLKALRFRWNAFRREWYGFGKRDEMEAVLRAQGAKVEVVCIDSEQSV